ncbi:conserved hypothetical protein [Burkholderia sp. 8Y]|uniref:hypothetical protein n=1 Tax=Burkholderia sp. 8Y TaxID=2653133 RepID=UPI0012F24DBA|nr:hypothetical protein [Burkholderia sp. 8Y]VXC60225.1 conserved hypothetical protein [Burkholderia sp. 8Y]
MAAEWQFEAQRRSQKSRDPMQASFFTNSSIDDDTHALVREAIQNSLDAESDRSSSEPVAVRFSVGSHAAASGVMERYVPREAWLHFNAADNGLSSPPTASDNCRYLVCEDFNTDGLVGNEAACEAQPKNSFYFFMRAEGQSAKQDGERGRHGIGKYVFPYTSGIRMFIAVTVRSSDRRCLIAGQSVLKSHHVGDKRYTPDGWWGRFEEDLEGDAFPLPVEDPALFAQLAADFNLARTLDRTGLSLIMPYVQSEVTANKLSEHVICEYFWPIMNGQLVVEVVEDGQSRVINSTSIRENLEDLIPFEQMGQIAPFIALASKAIIERDYPTFELSAPDSPSLPKWEKEYLPKQTATQIHEVLLRNNGFVRVRCHLHVQENGSQEAEASYFEIYLAKDLTDVSHKPRFLREGILIPEDRVPKVRGYTSMVVIEAGALATLLGDSENPAHTEWEKNATKFKGKYRWGPTTIDFVRLSVSKFLNLMSQGDEKEDLAILSDIFYLDLPENDDDVPESRKRSRRAKPGPEPEPSIEPPPPPRPLSYRLTRSKDGFVVKGPPEPLQQRRRYVIRVAYDFSGASKARALKQWDKKDFHLRDAKNVCAPAAKNVTKMVTGGNTVEFEACTNDFMLSVHGFDRRRDVIVDIISEVARDEAV